MSVDARPMDAAVASIVAPDLQEAAKLAALRRTKVLATAALCLCVALFAAARSLQPRWPWLGFVAAFAEAATIGGIADWYAVVALFKRPLGLPIPHTAIIPANQNRIADNLGHFIEVNFLAPEPVRDRLKQVDFAALVAEWLSDAEKASDLSRFVGRLVPQTVAAIEQSGLRDFITLSTLDQLRGPRVAPLAAELLTAVTDERRPQKLFDQLIGARHSSTTRRIACDARQVPRRAAFAVLPVPRRRLFAKKIVASSGAPFDQVPADENHPLRHESDCSTIGFIEQLRDLPNTQSAPRSRSATCWHGRSSVQLQTACGRTGAASSSRMPREDLLVRRHLTTLFVDIGHQLAEDPKIRADINQGFGAALSFFVESQKSEHFGFHRRTGEALGSGAADTADRDQYRARPAIYPLRRHADRRPRRARAAHRRTAIAGESSFSLLGLRRGCAILWVMAGQANRPALTGE